MSIEFLFRIPDNSLPFVDRSHEGWQKKHLETLNLTPGSSAGEVRSAAISFRRKFEEGGLNADSVRALRWALEITNDTNDDKEFLRFLLKGSSLVSIEGDRVNFR